MAFCRDFLNHFIKTRLIYGSPYSFKMVSLQVICHILHHNLTIVCSQYRSLDKELLVAKMSSYFYIYLQSTFFQPKKTDIFFISLILWQGRFSAVLYKGGNFCDFLFAFLHTNALLSVFNGKNLLK